MGPAKAFGLAELPSLRPISPAMGIAWLVAAVLFLTAGVCLFAWPRGWWAIALAAAVISQGAIVSSWAAAKFGTALNLLVLVGVVFGLAVEGPVSLRAQFEQQVDAGLARTAAAEPVTEADLAPLPAAVQRYLRGAGVVGQLRPQNIHVRMHGRIRSGPNAPWMPFTAEQFSFFDQPTRLFYMELSEGAWAVQGLHRYVGTVADMRVKVAGLVPVADAGGEAMTVSETVTMFNDMAILAPATLTDPAIKWAANEDGSAWASFENAALTVHATLEFNEADELVNFSSDDRSQLSADGKTMRRMRWSTPIAAPRAFGRLKLSGGGEARWHEAAGEYAYIEITFDEVQVNVRQR